MAMDRARVASEVVKATGGTSNINATAHCVTCLRLVLTDESRVDQAALDAVGDLKGTFAVGEVFQIVVGPGDVDIVYQRMVSDYGVREASKDEAKEEAEQGSNLFSRLIKMTADVFALVLPALVVDGLVMALSNVLQARFFDGKSTIDMYPAVADCVSLINLVSAAAFAFLSIFVGSSATRGFGGNVYLGVVMGVAMISDSLLSAYSMMDQNAVDAFRASTGANPTWHLSGLEVDRINYQAMVILVLCVAWVLSTIGKWLHKRLSGIIDFLLTPLIIILVTGFLTSVLVGPVTRQLSVLLTNGPGWAYNTLGVFGGPIFGSFYNLIVVTGLYQSFPVVEIPLLPQNGSPGDFVFPIASMANVVQGVAALAVFTKIYDAELKGLAGISDAPVAFGITEPTIFDVNLRLKWPFSAGIGAATIDLADVTLLGIRGATLGTTGFVGFVSIHTADIPKYLFLEAIVFVLSFGATFVYGLTRGKADVEARPAATGGADAVPAQVSKPTAVPVTVGAVGGAAAPVPAAAPALKPATIGDTIDYSITAPPDGQIVPLEQMKDESFARGMLGPGIAIAPTGGQVVSPVDGKAAVVFATGHAYGLKTVSGVQTLIHIGMDTVGLKGKGFTPRIAKGDMVRRGDVPTEVGWDVIREAGYDTITPIVVTNKKKFETVTPVVSGHISFGDMIIEVTPKA